MPKWIGLPQETEGVGKLEGKIALVRGGCSGIGLAIAQRFAREGAFVFVTGRRRAELEKAAELIRPEPAAIQADIASLDDLDKVYQEIRHRKGWLDVLVANAGGGTFAPIGATSEEHFDQTFGINVRGTLFAVQKALPLLSEGASIILSGSTAGSERHNCIRRLCCDQGRYSILCAELGDGSQGGESMCQCN